VPEQTILVTFEPQGGPPRGDPPAFDVTSGPGHLTLLDGDGPLPSANVSYETHVVMTSATTFVEDGVVSFDGGGLRISTIGEGILEPSADSGTLQGAVLWRVEGVDGFRGATGVLSSSFAIDAEKGTGRETQVLRLFRT
jgi:hypothetical protein